MAILYGPELWAFLFLIDKEVLNHSQANLQLGYLDRMRHQDLVFHSISKTSLHLIEKAIYLFPFSALPILARRWIGITVT